MLDAINADRRVLQQEMVDQAEALVRDLPLGEELPAAFALFDPAWHPGVVGLVASKLKDRVHRPVIAFAPAEPGATMLRGSARSIPGFHVRDALAAVDALRPGLIEKFGGHAMAAGLTLEAGKLEAFRVAFDAQARSTLSADSLDRLLATDGPLQPGELVRSLAEALELAGPWGQGFEEPVFDNEFLVREWKLLGGRHLKLVLEHADGGAPVSAIQFGGWSGVPPPARLHAAYQLAVDDYGGRKGVQLLVRHWLPA